MRPTEGQARNGAENTSLRRRSANADIVGARSTFAAFVPGGEEIIVISIFVDGASLNGTVVCCTLSERGNKGV